MPIRRRLLALFAFASLASPTLAGSPRSGAVAPSSAPRADRPTPRVVRSAADWKQRLTPTQFRVLREEGTEIAFTGRWWNHHARGTYVCAGCGLTLFSSTTKFESGTGWPSYWQPIARDHVTEKPDHSLGEVRAEVECARCGGHLGHVFDDGPKPTGLRYCMNSAALDFVPAR